MLPSFLQQLVCNTGMLLSLWYRLVWALFIYRKESILFSNVYTTVCTNSVFPIGALVIPSYSFPKQENQPSMNLKRRLLSFLVPLLLLALPGLAQTKTVTGKVTDDKGAAVQGASVMVKGTKVGTQTGADGAFSMTVPSSATTLVISSIGFAQQEVAIGGGNVSVSLQPAANSLNDVVVIGYGTAKRKDLTGAVASVGARDFNKGVQTAPDQLIQGKVAGVQVVNSSGQPGVATTVRIRGVASIRGGNNPLFVVDGVILDGRVARPGSNFSNDIGGNSPNANPLNFINPADIASMDILKDASATAIYGSRGANGVVIITTKRGQSGAPKVDFNASVGTSSLLRSIEVLNGDEYRRALTTYNLPGGNFGGNVDAMDAIMQNGISKNFGMAVSGGNDGNRYRLSLGVQDIEGIVRKTGFTKYTVNFSGGMKFLENKRLGFDYSVMTAQTKEDIAPITADAGFKGSLIGQALQWNPTRPLRTANGALNIDKGGDQINPLAMSEAYNDKATITTVLASIQPYYKFNDNLEYRFLYSVNYGSGIRKNEIKNFINIQGIQIDTTGSTVNRYGGFASVQSSELITQQFTHTLSFNKQLNSNVALNAVAGYEYMKFENRGSGFSGQDFANTTLAYWDYLQFGSRDRRNAYSYNDPSSELQSMFLRASVNLKDKYILNAVFRADGSSKFGENNKYGYFPSLGATWVASNEDFLKGNSVINSLKVRASYGLTGNQEFPAGASQERWSAGTQSFSRFQLENRDLKWETTTQLNFGVDFSILNDRLSGSVDYFVRNTKDLLFARDAADPVPVSNAKRWENLDGTIYNSGLELALNWNVYRQKDWNVDIRGNVAFLKNELRDFAAPIPTGAISGQGLTGAFVQRMVSNQPLNAYYVREFLGIDRDGNPQFVNNGETFVYKGSPNPTMLVGLSASVSYKRFSLDVNMNGAYGHYIYNNTANAILPINNLGSRNIASSLMQMTNREALSSSIKTSDRYLEKGDYIRLANTTLNYRVGNIGKTFRNVNVFITGQNLFVITPYSGFDPEVNTDKNIDGVPSFGIEHTPYPTARTFMFGVNFGL
jgi:iron complex outermembrane receptor protein